MFLCARKMKSAIALFEREGASVSNDAPWGADISRMPCGARFGERVV